MPTTIRCLSREEALTGATTIILVGSDETLREDTILDVVPEEARPLWPAMLDDISPGDDGGATSTWLAGPDGALRLIAVVLPATVSRYNAPSQAHLITDHVRAHLGKGSTAVLIALADPEHAFAAGCAAGRAIQDFDLKTGGASDAPDPDLRIAFLPKDTDVTQRIENTIGGIRLAARLVDTPPNRLTTRTFVQQARAAVDSLDVGFEVIQGEELQERGFGGLWNVGRAAVDGPALVVLSHTPAGAEQTLAWVAKGIVYDTGGLSIKGKDHMPGMKCDMGAAGAVLGAFVAAVQEGCPHNLHALLCLAENAVGPDSYRPDDVIRLYSGRTVEVNNTDAEGRLVLADGVAYAARHLGPDVIVDLATLTGAQLVATGKRHAAIICNDADLEARTIEAGRSSGDLVHPLPYCPEFYRSEFKSKVADMKNSVKDRMNAQTSCAAQFVAEHLGEFEGGWLHVDLAGPAFGDERGTGYGVALLLDLFDIGR